MSVNSVPYERAGLYFLGFGHTFIKYPRVVQTLEFTPAKRGRLHTRTSDGLPLTLGVSFQYRYMPEHLYKLYLNFREQHEPVYVETAMAVIANVACNYSAYTFFNDKQGIAIQMQLSLNSLFEKNLFAHVEAFQISEVELPEKFQDAIVTSISTKQEITQKKRYKDNMIVTFAQERMVAQQVQTQKVTIANGTARSRFEAASAAVTMTEQTVSAEISAYKKLADDLELAPSATLDYMWWDLLQDDQKDSKEFLIGVNPAAYISPSHGNPKSTKALQAS
eukprot:CAMPEP_0119305238 /NCGR_PEP_ID=MMETSP1333-20130426/6276_1 /TAXON_ID=418940 /ORGANISM="Scyphosphaera apsteinii, Strain RCC1455" /LENGTH=277 /DNA_ID=CAMNT_0007308283 /DNA_START=266 /DNA_END=1099 /DNA_ORIENTATION=+